MNNSENNIPKINKEIMDYAKKGNTNKLINNLSAEDKQKLNSILNDKTALESILKSPQAAALMKALGGKNG